MVLQDTTQFLVERQPEKLLAWLGNDAGSDEIRRMAGVTDRMLLEQWITYLPTVTGFLYPDAFRRLAIWLLRFSSGRYPVSELAATLFAWIKETDWKQQTPQQMEDYLFIRLYGGYNNSFLLPMDSLAEADLPEACENGCYKSSFVFNQRSCWLIFTARYRKTSCRLTGGWNGWTLMAGYTWRQAFPCLRRN